MSPGRRIAVVINGCRRYRNGCLLRGIEKKGDRVTFSYAGPAAL